MNNTNLENECFLAQRLPVKKELDRNKSTVLEITIMGL
jgi:hypothetical protein